MSIRSYQLGLSVAFPAMSKEELLDCWFLDGAWLPEMTKNLFNTAILRLIPNYITDKDVKAHLTSMRERQPDAPACLK